MKNYLIKKLSLGLLLLLCCPTATLALAPLDPYYSNQWYLKRISADKAWDLNTSSPDVVIAVIDTGVMIKHPDLADNIWSNPKEIPNNKIDDDHNGYVDDVNGWDFVNNNSNVEPKFKKPFTADGINHGTVIAGILAGVGNNYQGIAGLSWNAKIMSLKALDDSGKANVKSVVKAINYAINNGAKIINLSFVGMSSTPDLEKAIARARTKGVIIVAAGGNDSLGGTGQDLNKKPLYPVCSDGNKGENLVIGVAATGPLDQKANFSSFGNCIDLTAPGVSIFSTAVYSPEHGINDYGAYYDGYWSGTSFAVPMVSATLALMMQTNPSLPPTKLIEILLKTTDNNYSVNKNFIGKLGTGRLNVLSAIQAVKTSQDEETANILLFNDSTNQGLIKIVTAKGVVKNKFTTFTDTKISAVAGDFNGDKQIEIAVAPLSGEPEVRLYSQNGKLLKKFLAFEKNFKGGVNLAAGDLNNDGFDELVIAPASDHLSVIKVLDKNFNVKKSWSAYTANFRNGINLAIGDVNGDGVAEIVSAPAALGGSHIKMFTSTGKLVSQFVAFPGITGGFKMAVADAYSSLDQQHNLLITSAADKSPYIHTFSYRGELLNEFYVANTLFRNGLNVATADFDNDGQSEIVVGAGLGDSPRLMLYKNNGSLIKAFYADNKSLTQGVSVATFRLWK